MTATPTGIEIMEQFVPASPFAAQLGLAIEEIEDDRAVLRLPWRPEHATIGDVVHGGAIATLADTAAMTAAWAGAAVPAQVKGATVALTVTYCDAARAEDLLAEGVVARRGGRISTIDVTVRGADGRVVAKALATYQIG